MRKMQWKLIALIILQDLRIVMHRTPGREINCATCFVGTMVSSTRASDVSNATWMMNLIVRRVE